MALSDSMFLVELIVEELKSYVKCKDFIIKSQFADVFSITLQDPNEQRKVLTKLIRNKYSKRKSRIGRHHRPSINKLSSELTEQVGQSTLLAMNIELLITNMKKYPIELSLWSKLYPDYKLASTSIPWSKAYIDYLNKLLTKKHLQPVLEKREYNVFDEFTSKRMAVIKLNIKLSYLSNNIPKQLTLPSKECSDDAVINTGLKRNINRDENKRYRRLGCKKPKPLQKTDNQITECTTYQKSESKHVMLNNVDKVHKSKTVRSSIVSLVKSNSEIVKNTQKDLIKSKSCSSMNRDHFNILNYIFNNSTGPFGNQVYCVSYFTVKNDNSDSPNTRSSQSPKSPKSPESRKSPKSGDSAKSPNSASDPESSKKAMELYKLKLCDKECVGKNMDTDSGKLSQGSIDIPIPQDLSHLAIVNKCNHIDCKHKTFRKPPSPPDDRILLDLTSLKKDCCDYKAETGERVEKMEQVAGEMKAKMKIGQDPCYCECKCSFGFTKKTVYCKVCKGYESAGEELGGRLRHDMPFPCPIYHKIPEKKSRAVSLTSSDLRKSTKKVTTDKKSIESEKDTKKGKEKKKENKFKFNYGYTAPKIGHSRCALPCSGTLNPVPKEMGWLWNSDNIPGMKFRPAWKPGAVSKHVLKLLRIARNPGEAFAKKKRKKDIGKPKRPLKRPLIVVHKMNGEYTVTMETMKTYNKPRTVSQVPYEEKPLSTYKIGRTDEENVQRRKKKERARRRLERDQRAFIQDAFRDMCQDICLKTYQQALGILPDTENPDCTCYPAEPGPDRTDLDHSCSCSEDSNLVDSDTDSDEWMVEFTPPIAHYDPTYKTKKVAHNDILSQYSYLDYRVKLLDRYGNPVPRYFKGPDGTEQCSDLGGFWSPDHKWLTINVDGYVGPDGKWAPNTFIGPNNENVDAELGKFQAMDGSWLVVGIDGYVDSHGKWQFYHKAKPPAKGKKGRSLLVKSKKKAGDKNEQSLVKKKSEGTWSCFGDATAKYLYEMGIMGHGQDRKLLLDTLNRLIAKGEDVKIQKPINIPRVYYKKGKEKAYRFADERQCKHPKPSSKGVIAVDGHGNKTYFRLRDYKSSRPTQRIATLTDQEISVSSFHVPCFHSFISSEIMKRQQYERLVALAKAREEKNQPSHVPDVEQRNLVL